MSDDEKYGHLSDSEAARERARDAMLDSVIPDGRQAAAQWVRDNRVALEAEYPDQTVAVIDGTVVAAAGSIMAVRNKLRELGLPVDAYVASITRTKA